MMLVATLNDAATRPDEFFLQFSLIMTSTADESLPEPLDGLDSPAAETVRSFPTTPGVYLMKDAQDRVIYVGKAVNLRSRAGSYFTKAAQV